MVDYRDWISQPPIDYRIVSNSDIDMFRFKMRSYLSYHRRLLSNATPDFRNTEPMCVFSYFSGASSPSSSAVIIDPVAEHRFGEIDTQLAELEVAPEGDPDKVEVGAIESARAVISQVRANNLPAPLLSWLDADALAMLWVQDRFKYALTITEGEVGFVVHRDGETIRRASNIRLSDFRPLQIEGGNVLSAE